MDGKFVLFTVLHLNLSNLTPSTSELAKIRYNYINSFGVCRIQKISIKIFDNIKWPLAIGIAIIWWNLMWIQRNKIPSSCGKIALSMEISQSHNSIKSKKSIGTSENVCISLWRSSHEIWSVLYPEHNLCFRSHA